MQIVGNGEEIRFDGGEIYPVEQTTGSMAAADENPEAPQATPSLTIEQEQLIRDNLGLVYAIARSIDIYGNNSSDIIADGMIGLWKAAVGHDPAKGKFTSYARIRIRGKIIDGLRSFQKLRREDNYVQDLTLRSDTIRLDATIDPDDPNRDTYYEALAPSEASPEEIVIGQQTAEQRKRDLAEYMGALTAQQRKVVIEHSMGKDLQALGDEMGLSKGRASQIYGAALLSMRRIAGQHESLEIMRGVALSPYALLEQVMGMKKRFIHTSDVCNLIFPGVWQPRVQTAFNQLVAASFLAVDQRGYVSISSRTKQLHKQIPVGLMAELDLMSVGFSNYESALLRGITYKTAVASRQKIISLLGAANGAHAVRIALEQNLLFAEPAQSSWQVDTQTQQVVEDVSLGNEEEAQKSGVVKRLRARSEAHLVRTAYERGILKLSAA